MYPVKKEHEEFRSIFQHIQAAQLRRSPSELFAQHIVTIVHHIKGNCVILNGVSVCLVVLLAHPCGVQSSSGFHARPVFMCVLMN